MKYNDIINDYYNKDDFIGSFEVEDETIGTGLVGAPACGDVMKLQLKIEGDVIKDARILVFGCGSARASSNYAAEMLIGKTIQDAENIKDADIAEALGLPKIKMHCSVLAEGAIKKAIKNYKEKQLKTISVNNVTNNANTSEKKFNLTISDEALDYIKKVLTKSKKDYIGVKIYLEESNCGMSYKVSQLSIDADVSNYHYYEQDGIKFFTSADIVNIIDGTKMSYQEEGLKSGIIFTNPNEVDRCGCGANFQLTKEAKQNECNN